MSTAQATLTPELISLKTAWIPAHVSAALADAQNADWLRLSPKHCHSMDRRIALQLVDTPPNMGTLERCDLHAGDILIAEMPCKPKDGATELVASTSGWPVWTAGVAGDVETEIVALGVAIPEEPWGVSAGGSMLF